ncbi:MAG: NUDIX hydrolase [Candidatus Tectomicrobia bacterium]|nr:NUDIX hydrolase [Candidatus Tectomicrobia bacterium]
MTATVNGKREIYKGRIVHLFVEDVTLPNGTPCSLEIIRHMGAAAIVPLLPDGRVVMVHQYRHATGGRLWEIPAGTLAAGETPEVCAHRELAEETGYRAGSLEKIAEIFTAPGFCDEKIHIFLATGLTPCRQTLDADEVLSVEPRPLEELMEMVWRFEISDAKSIAGLSAAYHRRLDHRRGHGPGEGAARPS